MATRTPAKKTAARQAKKAATKKPAVKKTPPAEPVRDHETQVDLRHPLPTRTRRIVGPLGATEQAAVRAALASAMLQLPIPVTTWHGPTAELQDGTRITHTDPRPPAFTTPTNPPQFTVHIPCLNGATHEHHVRSAPDLAEARAATRTCTIRHGMKTTAVLPLREGIHRATSATAKTQPMSRDEIAAGLNSRAASAEQPKEHPQP